MKPETKPERKNMETIKIPRRRSSISYRYLGMGGYNGQDYLLGYVVDAVLVPVIKGFVNISKSQPYIELPASMEVPTKQPLCVVRPTAPESQSHAEDRHYGDAEIMHVTQGSWVVRVSGPGKEFGGVRRWYCSVIGADDLSLSKLPVVGEMVDGVWQASKKDASEALSAGTVAHGATELAAAIA